MGIIHILLMEEIRLTSWDVKNPAKNGKNYQPQLVSRISSIHSINTNPNNMLTILLLPHHSTL